MTSVRQTFPATSKGARAARTFASAAVDTSAGLAEEVALVVSELAANAVLHAATPFTVAVHQEGTAVRIEVEDTNPTIPKRKNHGQAAPTGRGLWIVEQLARAWGVVPTADGKVVWVELQPVEQAVG